MARFCGLEKGLETVPSRFRSRKLWRPPRHWLCPHHNLAPGLGPGLATFTRLLGPTKEIPPLSAVPISSALSKYCER